MRYEDLDPDDQREYDAMTKTCRNRPKTWVERRDSWGTNFIGMIVLILIILTGEDLAEFLASLL